MQAGLETRVLTVPIHSVNDELAVRQAFGWNLAQASARSFATGGNMAMVGTDVGAGVMMGAGHVSMQNAHYTDITLQRTPGPRSAWLARLEEQYDSIAYLPDASHWSTVIVASLVFAIGLYGSAGMASALGQGDSAIHPLMFLLPLAAGILLGVLLTRSRQAKRNRINAQREKQQLAILNQARGQRT